MESLRPLTCENSGPQTGISGEPWAPPTPLRRMFATWSAGNLPSFFLASSARFAGGIFSEAAAGPLPLPSFPWHGAQYELNISLPDAGEVIWIGSFLT